jgi:hypothetical protein
MNCSRTRRVEGSFTEAGVTMKSSIIAVNARNLIPDELALANILGS